MASSFSSFDIGVSLDELTCSVCFELYKEPIAFPCGHSFCRVCVEKYWKTREGDTRCVCPNCHEVFLQKTKLKKNVIIANFVEKIKLKKREVGLGVEVRNVEHGGVYINKGVKSGGTDSSCELCDGEAAKMCVPCELLCCEQHLKPHQHKGHKLVDPGVKIEEFICIEHGKPIQLYCKDDESLMCLMCMGGQHQGQKVVAVEIAHAELMGVLAAKYPHVLRSMQSVASHLQQVQEEEEQTEQFGRDAEDMLEEKRRGVCQFVNEYVDLMKSQINKRKMEKLSLLGKQREKLEQQMESLRQGKLAMQTALQDLEAISFIQGSKDLLNRFDCTGVQHIIRHILMFLPQLEAMSDLKTTPLTVLDFSKEKNNLDMLIKLNKNFLEKILRPVEHVVMVELDRNNLRSLYGQTPRLDPNSAHPLMMISQDLGVATLTKTQHPYPEHPDRFDICPQVVSSESFSSGRHYWEVDVSSSRYCRIGICLNSMERKGRGKECGLGGNPESWCFGKCDNKYSACHNYQETPLSMSGDPERFGFFLDCEAGELTCFGDSRVLHVFRGSFMFPVKPAFAVYLHDDVSFGGSVRFCSF